MTREELIKQELKKTKGYSKYNNWSNSRTDYGYHSFNIDEINIIGQRNPTKRLTKIKEHINLEEKTVFDFGCNVGGMLLHLPEIKYGIGFDYDDNCIIAANNISQILKNTRTDFYTFDFNNDDYSTLDKYVSFNPDIVFVLSMGAWVSDIIKLHEFCIKLNSIIILETNNDKLGKIEIDFYKKNNYDIKLISDNSDDDITPENKNSRKMYIIRKK
jgi:SAM-dependent methyltransferase